MKKNHLLLAGLFMLAAACNNESKKEADTAAKKDTTSQSAATPAPDSATMMKNWEAYMTPGEMHKMMASWNGKWTADVTSWMAEDAPPTKSTGTAVNSMALGGRYQVSSFKGNFNGMPFEGMGTLAYDNAKKTFISTWLDNMGTGVMKLEGTWDAAAKTMDMRGKMVDPGTGKEVDAHETFVVKDDKTQVMTMYAPGANGKEFKTMEIIFTRN